MRTFYKVWSGMTKYINYQARDHDKIVALPGLGLIYKEYNSSNIQS